MIVVDTSALVAIVRDEPEGGGFRERIVDEDRCLVSSVSVLEASIILAGRDGDAWDWTELDRLLGFATVEVVAQTWSQARTAREAFLRFGKGRHPAALNFGDCASYALAKERGLPLLFKGGDFNRTDIASAVPAG